MLISGCQTIPDSSAPAPESDRKHSSQTGTSYGNTRQTAPRQNTTTVALSEMAQKQAAGGNTANARRTIERALRIEPRDASLWNELAHLYFRDGMFNKAANTAAKSNSLAGSNNNLRHDNWLLIARAREKTGDENGARMAEENALRYR